ncbi:hypothetical protein [Amycolatopsis rubida]|uniref:hypothetical protein n=1 Tax=Amycolatopsis rubida TaxID=112413 RepID=UPI000AF0E979|nr:hypothetical protein [Amycolatopsis rubida]
MLNEGYAVKVERDWNVRYDGAGYVTRFRVETRSSPVIRCGRRAARRSWSCGFPPRSRRSSTRHLAGEIEAVHEFR